MATREIKTRFKLEGDDEYQKSLKKISSELSTMRSEMKVVTAQYEGNEKSVEALEAKTEALGKQYDKQKEKLETLRAAMQNAQEVQTKANAKVEECREKYNRAQQELENYKKSTNKTAEEQKRLETALEEAGKELQIAEKGAKSAAESVESYGKKANYTQAEVYQLGNKLDETNKELEQARSEAQGVSQTVDKLGDEMKEGAEKSEEFGDKSSQGIGALASALAAAGIKESLREIVNSIKECTDASIKYESAITGVYKTVNGTDTQLQRINDGIKEMSTQIPATTTQIAGVAEAAGQLGIATDDVLDFTRVMIDLGESTNLSADEAASALAKFSNITGTSAANYGRLGSVIVGLGNNFATTEADIVSMGTRLASAGTLAGLTEPEIMALATAMSSVGIEAEAGGTAMTQTLSAIETAVANGGDKLEEYARISGISAKEFSSMWKTHAVDALQLFIAGLGKLDEQGESATIVLDDLGLSGVRQSNMLKSLSLAAETMTGAVDLANEAWTENTALTEEAGKRYETTESKLAMASNAFDNLKVAIGDQLNPVLEKCAEGGAQAFTWAADFIDKNSWVVGALTSVTTAIGLLAVGVAGYNIATTIAIPATEAFTAALLANPVGQVAVALVAVTAAVTGVAIAMANSEPPTDKYKEAIINAREASDDLEASLETLNDTIADNEYNTDQVRVYIKELQRLEEAGLENASVNELYQETLDKIREIMPDLSVSIDETTGAVEGGTDALLAQAEAWENQENATDALRVLEDAKNAYETTKQAVDENREAMDALGEEYDTINEQLNGTNSTVEYGSEKWWELYNRMNEIAGVAIPEYQAQDEALREELELQKATMDEAQASYDRYNQTVNDSNDVIQAAQTFTQGITTTFDALTQELEALQAEYAEAEQAAYNSLTSQFGLFNTMTVEVDTSVSDMIGSLDSQIAFMDKYADNMRRAAELGIDEGLLQELSDGSVESAKYLQAIVDDGGEHMEQLNSKFKKVNDGKTEFSKQLAEMQTDFSKRMSNIEQRLDQTTRALDRYSDAADATNHTVQGIVNTAYARQSSVWSAYYALGQTASAAYRAANKIRSPSRVFMELTDYTVQGITLQAEKRKPDVAKTYSDLAGTASGAYYDATQKTKELYAQTVHSYNTYAVGGGVGGTVQLDRIADKLDELTRVTEGSKIDEGEFADKLGTAMEKVNIKAEAVISSRRVAAEIASDMDKEQGETLALRDRGVI